MTQGSLLDLHTPRQKKRGHVHASSVAAYLERPRDGRVADVVRILAQHPNVTGAELAEHYYDTGFHVIDIDELWHVRRGLSDALAMGAVEHAGKRKCRCIGRVSLTWRVVGR